MPSSLPAPGPDRLSGRARGVGGRRRWAVGAGLALGLILAGPGHAAEPSDTGIVAPASPGSDASATARDFSAWVIGTGDSQGLPFLVIDKVHAQVLAFDGAGRWLGSAPALLGLAAGDESPPGIGDMAMAAIPPEQRITPAGRFLASIGDSAGGKAVLWIDYETALALHAVVTTRAADRRLQRLATETAGDNRISYGCVNVPVSFYDDVVRPAFHGTVGVVYILPEVRSLSDVFAAWPA